MGTTPLRAWPVPDLGTAPPDGPAAFSALGLAIESSVNTPSVQTYTPVWTSAGSPKPSLPSTLVGKYSKWRGYCDFAVYIGFNSSTVGGVGWMSISLPVQAATDGEEQWVDGKLYLPAGGGNYRVAGLIGPGWNDVRPYVPLANTNTGMEIWQNSDATAAAGTGRPYIAGQFSVQNGGNFSLTGRYRHA